MNSFVEHLRETGACYYDPAKTPRFIEYGELKPIDEINGMVLFYDEVSGYGEIRKDGQTISWGGNIHNHIWGLVKAGWTKVDGEWKKPEPA